jgi:16S rRNA (guanine966-N2)-methyltransferase
MRITTGKYKGRIIKMPKHIRPTQEKVRKAIFDILGDIEGLSFLELFAGSGAVGFEAVSRGVKELTLVEYDPECLLVIRKNIETLKIKNCSLYPKETIEAIKAFGRENRKFNSIFLDPPYYKDRATPNPNGGVGVPLSAAKKILQTLGEYDILTPQGLVITQHSKKDMLPETAGSLILFRQSHYGDTVLSFYRKL